MHQCINFILFRNDALHVSDGLSVIIRSTRLYIQQQAYVKQTAVSVWHKPVAVCTVLKSWWWTERPSETRRGPFQNKKKFIHWCILLVLLQKYITMQGLMNVRFCTSFFTPDLYAQSFLRTLFSNTFSLSSSMYTRHLSQNTSKMGGRDSLILTSAVQHRGVNC